ncbi:hypothetical protein WJX81_000822 [Elliptochloris bilobata]|uniref:ditrans,polycis-polyprenyl diphosphate synthase [(2E,6E)-farnesyldiphosphate specific] n=1 Tax=Elliptochloris bilobata TaxID=381761 RepID=A0AAW1QW15_9CHLO
MSARAGLTDVSVYDPAGFVRESAAEVSTALRAAHPPLPVAVALQVGSHDAPRLLTDPEAAQPACSDSAAGPAWAPETELILVFGPAFTLAGFPPWRLRLAEVYHLGALRALTPLRFEGVLRRYRRTHQRFGT